jgi:hypothetical protein
MDRHTLAQSYVVASRPSELPRWATKTARLGPKRQAVDYRRKQSVAGVKPGLWITRIRN